MMQRKDALLQRCRRVDSIHLDAYMSHQKNMSFDDGQITARILDQRLTIAQPSRPSKAPIVGTHG